MITGDARRSQSAKFFRSLKKAGEETSQRSKRLRQEDESTPGIVLDAPSTSALIEEEPQPNLNLLFTDEQREKQTTYLAIKLNRLHQKDSRFKSHRDFLSQCIREKLIPKGLQLMLEPTIGNHNQEFLDNWYSKLKEFSLSLMEGIVQFCDKTINIKTEKIITTESSLKASTTNNNRFQEVKAEIMKNEESSKKMLRQRKFKKFSTLKYRPTVPSHTNSQEDDATQDRPRKLLYSDTAKRNPCESSINKKANELQVPTKPTDTVQQSRTLNTKKRGKSPIRSQSNTKQHKNEQLKAQIEQLKDKVKVLKNNNKTETAKNTDTFTSMETPKQNSKIVQMASSSQGGQQKNMEIIQVISFITETIQKLKTFDKRLQLDSSLAQ